MSHNVDFDFTSTNINKWADLISSRAIHFVDGQPEWDHYQTEWMRTYDQLAAQQFVATGVLPKRPDCWEAPETTKVNDQERPHWELLNPRHLIKVLKNLALKIGRPDTSTGELVWTAKQDELRNKWFWGKSILRSRNWDWDCEEPWYWNEGYLLDR